MSLNLTPLWANINSPDYELNAANLSKMCPSVLYSGVKQIIHAASKTTLKLNAGIGIKLVQQNVHSMFTIDQDIEFNPVSVLDTGSTLDVGTDYYVYIVGNGATSANIVVSKNSTFPEGASAENSRKIGGFHTLCADVGTLQIPEHNLYGYMAGNILPQSCHDLLNRPYCNPKGMVKLTYLPVWVDIYLQSEESPNTSFFNATVKINTAWDNFQGYLQAAGKRMLTDVEFTYAALGTEPGYAVEGTSVPTTTGGHINTNNKRIISYVGCEDTCGTYFQLLGPTSLTAYDNTNPVYTDVNFGYQCLPMNVVSAGGIKQNDYSEKYCGPRCRHATVSRDMAYMTTSSRGACDAISVI